MSYQSYPSCLSSLIANGLNTAIIGELGISADIDIGAGAPVVGIPVTGEG